MHYLDVTIEDHVVPQLFTSALEAYEIGESINKKKRDKLETFGLLWGYVLPEREDRRPRVVATFATVETSALRKNDSVAPKLKSLAMKMEFLRQYWPHVEVVGTFHSHPYASVSEVRECKGWRASRPEDFDDGGCDTSFWPEVHEKLFPTTPYLAHVIVTVAAMQKNGWALPKHIEDNSGLELSMGRRKLWITSYATEMQYLELDDEDEYEADDIYEEDGDEDEEDDIDYEYEYEDDDEEGDDDIETSYAMMENLPALDIPSLTMRVLNGNC